MISFLASPKAFGGLAALQQRRAIDSWLALAPGAEVFLYGNADGTGACARNLGVAHVPDIPATAQGVPYFGAIVEHAKAHAKHDIQVYLNCDILLTQQLAVELARINRDRFLLIGQRIDLAEGESVDVNRGSVVAELRQLALRGRATLHPPSGADYFAFRRGTWKELPPVIIGRGGYDNALVVHCLRGGIPVIDATLAVLAVHQFHDYQHLAGGRTEVFRGADALINRQSIPEGTSPSIEDADYVLRGSSLMRNRARGDVLWHAYLRACVRGPAALGRMLHLCWRACRRAGIVRRWEPTLDDVLSALERTTETKAG